MTERIGRGSSAILLFSLAVVAGAGVADFTCFPECVCTGIAISCRENGLPNIPTFENINGANIVDLSGNEIEEVDYEELNWKGIEQLQYVYLNVNCIVFVSDEAFEVFRNLEYLDLSNNLLEFLPSRIFETNNRLATVKLAGNPFGQHTPELVSKSITSLDLSFCKLETFSSIHINSLPNLQELNLQANNLFYINPANFNNVIKVQLGYNPWACNCSTVEVYNWAKANSDRISIEDPINCASKTHIFIDLFKKARMHLQKESCFIDAESFEPPLIKRYSLVKQSNNTERPQDTTPSRTSYTTIVLVSTLAFVSTVSISVSIGFILIRFLPKRNSSHQQQLSEHLLREMQ